MSTYLATPQINLQALSRKFDLLWVEECGLVGSAAGLGPGSRSGRGDWCTTAGHGGEGLHLSSKHARGKEARVCGGLGSHEQEVRGA
ncbi:hypothetical protein DF3PA_50005 [Candidatus Defluviicoccus seviourii]|uniref:Uncharacterized protein n=1 Tax=Candidatus Defluviicoccus seviourii TaxID=2565273 RepID=A0A564WH92_9PROT|nr:hypothetical protein DF3PA_50005 [Candidatus Defluviicoccus seviourii]